MHIYSAHESSSFAWIFLFVCCAAIMHGLGNTDVANAIMKNEINERRAMKRPNETEQVKMGFKYCFVVKAVMIYLLWFGTILSSNLWNFSLTSGYFFFFLTNSLKGHWTPMDIVSSFKKENKLLFSFSSANRVKQSWNILRFWSSRGQNAKIKVFGWLKPILEMQK